MDARRWQFALVAALVCSLGASQRSENFVVSAPNAQLAHEVAQAAEKYRHDLAIEWLGRALPRWGQPCPIEVRVGRMGAGGATSFMFDRGRPFGWRMSVQGSRERILDSVLPHEVTHTIFATHFGRPLPRWADEGACTTVEHESERNKQHQMLIQFLTSAPSRGIPFNRMFAMTEYPSDIMPLYSQGYSLVRYLIAQGGKRKFVDYVGAGMQTGDWPAATSQFYGFRDLSELQLSWVAWVRNGYPQPNAPTGDSNVILASADTRHLVPQASGGSGEQTAAKVGEQAASSQVAMHEKSSPGSWYARQGGTTRVRPTKTLDAGQPFTPAAATTTVPGGSLSRPPGPQRLQQPLVLQWQRTPAALEPIRRAIPAVPARRVPLSSGGTVWR